MFSRRVVVLVLYVLAISASTSPTEGEPALTDSPTLEPSVPPESMMPTALPSTLPSKLPTRLPTKLPTNQPSTTNPTSFSPTTLPTDVPTQLLPSNLPTNLPSDPLSDSPTGLPSRLPTQLPSRLPTKLPSELPSRLPSESPTKLPSELSTDLPSRLPTELPSRLPTDLPSKLPTELPTKLPTTLPTDLPTKLPTELPTRLPTELPTRLPTELPTKLPTELPTRLPTELPTPLPSKLPSMLPSKLPSKLPTLLPTKLPTRLPSSAPTSMPTTLPSLQPTSLPTSSPTAEPTTNTPTLEPTPPPRLNVLLIIADDFKSLPSSPIPLTHLNKLHSESISFMNAHAQMSICGPSRASFLTSLRPDVTKIYGLGPNLLHTLVKKSRKSKLKEILLLPQIFKMDGYATYGVGKVFHESEFNLFSDASVWTEPMYSYLPGLARPPVFTPPYQGSWINQPNVSDDFFADGQAARLGARLILDVLSPNQDTVPWFLAVGLWKPHVPWAAPLSYFTKAGNYETYSSSHHDGAIAGLKKYEEYTAKGSGCGEVRQYTGSAPKVLGKGQSTQDELKRANHAYHATSLYMDEQLGILLQALDESNSRMDTVVVFMGDHGFHLGDHGLYCKHTNFEQGTKVPFVIRPAPRENFAFPGSQSFAPVELLDLMPTLVEMANLQVDLYQYRAFQGKSLLPILFDPENGAVKSCAVSQYFRGKGQGKIWGYSIRTTRFRYTNWGGKFQETYDYLVDEWETKSIAAAEDYGLNTVLAGTYKTRVSMENGIPFDFEERTAMRDRPLSPFS